MFKKILFVVMAIFLNSSLLMANESKVITGEFSRALELISNLEPDSMVGDYLYEKNFAGYDVLWRVSDVSNIVITFYKKNKDYRNDFRVSYYKSTSIVPGEVVIRRLVGNILNGDWKNHTVNFSTGAYLGWQGFENLDLKPSEESLLSKLNIKNF